MVRTEALPSLRSASALHGLEEGADESRRSAGREGEAQEEDERSPLGSVGKVHNPREQIQFIVQILHSVDVSKNELFFFCSFCYLFGYIFLFRAFFQNYCLFLISLKLA